jgi:hypothetical protein
VTQEESAQLWYQQDRRKNFDMLALSLTAAILATDREHNGDIANCIREARRIVFDARTSADAGKY